VSNLSFDFNTKSNITDHTAEHTPPQPQPDRLVLDLPTP